MAARTLNNPPYTMADTGEKKVQRRGSKGESSRTGRFPGKYEKVYREVQEAVKEVRRKRKGKQVNAGN